MQKLVTICGLPRAGSTLLQNTLSQNPEFEVSRLTSNVPGHLEALRQSFSNSQETPGYMLAYPDHKERRENALRGVVEAFYPTDKVVVSKSRGWTGKVPLARQLYPGAKSLVCIRDPRDVFASIERLDMQDRTLVGKKGPMSPATATLMQKAKAIVGETGMVGSCISDVMDIYYRKQDHYLVKFEDFVVRPRLILAEIYDYLELEHFDHDVNNVPQYAQDLDEIYLRKFLHTACGKIVPPKGKWSDCYDQFIADKIIEAWPQFYQAYYSDLL